VSRIGRLLARFRDPTIRRIFVDARLTTAASIVSAAIGIVRNALLARYLGVGDFGRLAVISSATLLIRQLVSVRSWEWTQIQMAKAVTSKDREQAGAAMKAGYLLGFTVNVVACVLIVVLGAWLCAEFLEEPALATLLRINALLLLGMWADDASTAGLRVIGRFRWIAGYTVLAPLIRLAAVVPVFVLDLGLSGVIVSQVAIQALISLWLFVSTRHKLVEFFGGPLGGRIIDLIPQFRGHIRLLATLSISDSIKTVATDGDNLIIGAFHSAEAVGPYRAANTIISGLHQLAVPLYMVFYPEMAKAAAAGDRRAVRRLTGQIALFGAACGVVASVALVIAAPWIVDGIYGPEFAAATAPLQIMSWSLLVLGTQWANPLFVSIGRPGWSLIMLLAGMLAKVALLVTLVPGLVHIGAAVGYLGFYVAAIVAAIVLGLRARHLLEQP
jgi:O-antigen/teichoic acid export membrane protein